MKANEIEKACYLVIDVNHTTKSSVERIYNEQKSDLKKNIKLYYVDGAIKKSASKSS